MAESDNNSDSLEDMAAAWWRDILIATRALTLLRPKIAPEGDEDAVARSRRAFPVVGLAIGLGAALVYGIASALHLGAFASALIAFGAVAAVTGARGETGLARFAEGLLGGANADERRAIMLDTTPGYAGMAAIFFSILLRAVLVAAASVHDSGAAVLIAALLGSRATLPHITMGFPAIAGESLGGLAREAGANQVWIASVAGALLVLVFLFSLSGIFAILLAAGAAFGTAWAALKLIGGLNMPALMAVQQAAEVALIIGAAARL